MVTPAARREAVAHLRLAYQVSERRACSALGADRTSVRYRSTRPGRWNCAGTATRAGIHSPAVRLSPTAHLAQIVMNRMKRRRLYREEGLQVRRAAAVSEP